VDPQCDYVTSEHLITKVIAGNSLEKLKIDAYIDSGDISGRLDSLLSYRHLQELSLHLCDLSTQDIHKLSLLSTLHSLFIESPSAPSGPTISGYHTTLAPEYPRETDFAISLAAILCKERLPLLANFGCMPARLLIDICRLNTCHVAVDESCFKRLNRIHHTDDFVDYGMLHIREPSELSVNLLEYLNITTPLQTLQDAWCGDAQVCVVGPPHLLSFPLSVARLCITRSWDVTDLRVYTVDEHLTIDLDAMITSPTPHLFNPTVWIWYHLQHLHPPPQIVDLG